MVTEISVCVEADASGRKDRAEGRAKDTAAKRPSDRRTCRQGVHGHWRTRLSASRGTAVPPHPPHRRAPGRRENDPRPAVSARRRQARRVVHVHHAVGNRGGAARERRLAWLGPVGHPHSGASTRGEPAPRRAIHAVPPIGDRAGRPVAQRLRGGREIQAGCARCSTRCRTCGCSRATRCDTGVRFSA